MKDEGKGKRERKKGIGERHGSSTLYNSSCTSVCSKTCEQRQVTGDKIRRPKLEKDWRRVDIKNSRLK